MMTAMRDDVAIVLNEREESKARGASMLEEILKQRNITVFRLEPSSNLAEQLQELKPGIIILDYLIGDYTTGLDLMTKLSSDSQVSPDVYFLTDEPSVQVAVEAMRCGAKNYLELDSPSSIPKLADQVQNSIHSIRSNEKRNALSKEQTLETLVGSSKAFKKCLEKAKSIAEVQIPLVVIYGEKGSGKSALSHAIYKHQANELHYLDFDLQYTTEQLEKYILSPSDLYISIDNFEQDDGELLSLIEQHKETWAKKQTGSWLTLATSSLDAFKIIQKALPAQSLEIPDLETRKEDIADLVEHAYQETKTLSKRRLKRIEEKNIAAIVEMDWPGQAAQIVSVVTDALISAVTTKESFLEHIEQAKEIWEQDNILEPNESLSSIEIARAMLKYKNNLRLAAIELGTTTQHLYTQIEKIHSPLSDATLSNAKGDL